MAYQKSFEGALDKAISNPQLKMDEPTYTGKCQKAENTGTRVGNYIITPGYFGPYAHASISPVLPPRSTMFEWHKSRRRVPATVDKVLIEELQKMHIAKILEAHKKSAFTPQSSTLNGRLHQKFLAQKRDSMSDRDRKPFESRWAACN
ncbi:uncharacterized protein EAF01_010107 [Botrytis porri]|uniref:uncharacterized protein n=1 Tax=Botrytis porri TaxID=87229 RepID=UPI0018FF756F|nr:uncharacterized protein EAF01_010107 [Botrytis porri]KAF7894657.1 hypothetical protein EAF01_010107 [Botrytis porri]